MNSKNKGLFVLMTFIVLAVALIVTSVLVRTKFKTDQSSSVSSVSTQSVLSDKEPTILNVPSNIAIVGQEFTYPVKVTDPDTSSENITLTLVENPAWVTSEGLVIKGTPTEADRGDNKIVFEISDGIKKVAKIFYLKVE